MFFTSRNNFIFLINFEALILLMAVKLQRVSFWLHLLDRNTMDFFETFALNARCMHRLVEGKH